MTHTAVTRTAAAQTDVTCTAAAHKYVTDRKSVV